MIPLVAIIGRPNVGKSALFNRILGTKHAIVSDVYGTTRDSISGTISHKKKEIEFIDTAGITDFATDTNEDLEQNVQLQAKTAREGADLILFLIDGTVPLTRDDLTVAGLLRKSKQPVLLVVTKCDNDKSAYEYADFYKLGFSDPILVSAMHNRGITTLLDSVHAQLKKAGYFKGSQKTDISTDQEQVSVCLVGKPNVGKSSLFNQLQNKRTSVVSNVPGTTRDTIDILIPYQDKTVQLIDTAGLRRPGKREGGIEQYSTLRTMRAIKRADIALFLIDASETVSRMDHAVARYVLDEQKGLILVVNKWDLFTKDKTMMDRFLTYLQDRFKYIPWAPVVFISAKTGQNIDALLEQVVLVDVERKKRIETGKLNRFIEQVCLTHPPGGTKKIVPKILYTTQAETNPPLFVLFVNKKEAFHFSWVRYLENRLRETFSFAGTPIVLEMREREKRFGRKNS